MTDTKTLADKRGGMVYFRPDRMKPKPGLNTRDFSHPDNFRHVETLMDQIEGADGLLTPLLITKNHADEILIIDGESRWRALTNLIAAGRLPADYIAPCTEQARGTNAAHEQLNIIIANSGKQLFPVEVAQAIKQAISFGSTEAIVAKTLGKSVSWVTQQLDFLAAPQAIHDAVKAGDISPTLAAKITREEGAEKAVATVKEAVVRAKASGKKKATAKHVAGRTGTYSVRDAGGGSLTVAIDGKAFKYSQKHWAGLARCIAMATKSAKDGHPPLVYTERNIKDQSEETEPSTKEIEHA